jgi:hypothetical protein
MKQITKQPIKQESKQTLETIPMHAVPEKISEYLNGHFSSDFVCGIVKRKDKKGEAYYDIDVTHDGLLYQINFDSEGNFISKTIELASGSCVNPYQEVGTVD